MSDTSVVNVNRVPVCLPCWRRNVSMTEDPPHDPSWPEETCMVEGCGRRTNHGIYVTLEEAMSFSVKA